MPDYHAPRSATAPVALGRRELRAAKFPYAVQAAHSMATDMPMLSLLHSKKVCFIIVIEKGRL